MNYELNERSPENPEDLEQSEEQKTKQINQDQDNQNSLQNGEKAIPPNENLRENVKDKFQEKQNWWPSCMHLRRTTVHKTTFRDRIVILWRCRRCPRRWTETIERNINSRNIYVKSTTEPLETDSRPHRQ